MANLEIQIMNPDIVEMGVLTTPRYNNSTELLKVKFLLKYKLWNEFEQCYFIWEGT